MTDFLNKISSAIPDLFLLIGLGSFSYGLFLFSPRLSYTLTGVVLILLSVLPKLLGGKDDPQ